MNDLPPLPFKWAVLWKLATKLQIDVAHPFDRADLHPRPYRQVATAFRRESRDMEQLAWKWWRRHGPASSTALNYVAGFYMAVFTNKYSGGQLLKGDWMYLWLGIGLSLPSIFCWYMDGSRSRKNRKDLKKRVQHVLNAVVEATQHNVNGVARPRAAVRLLREENDNKRYSLLFPYVHDGQVKGRDRTSAVAICREDRNSIVICRAALTKAWVTSGNSSVTPDYSIVNAPIIPTTIRSVAACPIFRRSDEGDYSEQVIGTLSLDSTDSMSISGLDLPAAINAMTSTAKLLSIELSDHYDDLVDDFPAENLLYVNKLHNNPPIRVHAPPARRLRQWKQWLAGWIKP